MMKNKKEFCRAEEVWVEIEDEECSFHKQKSCPRCFTLGCLLLEYQKNKPLSQSLPVKLLFSQK